MRPIFFLLWLICCGALEAALPEVPSGSPQETVSQLDLKKVFISSPFIYSLLIGMSTTALGLWIYSLSTLRARDITSKSFSQTLRPHLKAGAYAEAIRYCTEESHLLALLLRTGLATRGFGGQIMVDAMKSEGKRLSTPFWQRLSLLNDIAITAPMLGLLGTVLGMFYAFYDMHRSLERINILFDGLGIAVGTTVAGLVVSIFAMILHTTLKNRLVRMLSHVESEAMALSTLIDTKPWT